MTGWKTGNFAARVPARRWRVAATLVLLAGMAAMPALPVAGQARAAEFEDLDWSVKGDLSAKTMVDVKRESDLQARQALDGRARIENVLRFGNSGGRIGLHGEARYEAFDTRESGAWSFLLREAYAEIRRETFTLGIGRQIVTWGKLDDLMILDQLSPQDFRWFALYDKQDRKIPVFMLTAGYFGPRYGLEAVVIPSFEPSEADLFGTDWAVFGRLKEQPWPEPMRGMVEAIRVDDRQAKGEAEGGIRLRATEGRTDYALYYMTYFDRFPALREYTPVGRLTKQFLFAPGLETLTALAAARPTPLDLTLDAGRERVHAMGMDFESTAGSYGLRGELGFFDDLPYTRARDLAYVREKTLAAGMGVDYTTIHNLYWNVQFIATRILSNETMAGAESFSQEIVFNMNREFLMGDLRLEFSGLYQIAEGGWMARPEATYKARPGLDLVCGLFLLGGDRDSLFGRYRHKDMLYSQIRYQF